MAQRNITNSNKRSMSAKNRNSGLSGSPPEGIVGQGLEFCNHRNLPYRPSAQSNYQKSTISWNTNVASTVVMAGRSQKDDFADLLPDELKMNDHRHNAGTSRSFTATSSSSSNGITNNYNGDYQGSVCVSFRAQKPIALKNSFSNPINNPFAEDPFAMIQVQAWKEKVDSWFKEADVDSDGLVAGDEAANFFRRSGLSDSSLSEMWGHAVPFGEKGMDKARFDTALKLIAMMQSNSRLTSDSVSRAALQLYPSPLPNIAELEKEKSIVYDFDDSSSSSSEDSEALMCTRAHSMPMVPGALSWLNQGGELDLGLRTHPIYLDVPESQELQDYNYDEEQMPPPCCSLVSVDLRLPSLDPKNAPKLWKLIETNNSLLAYPNIWPSSTTSTCEPGGLLQWVNVSNAPPGSSAESNHYKDEDWDSTPCYHVFTEAFGTITSVLYDQASEIVWMGNDQGMIASYHVGGASRVIDGKSDIVKTWKSHKHGAVSAMVLSTWGDLWSGSSKGSLRMWTNAASGARDQKSKALRTCWGDKPHSDIQSIVVSSCGSVIWTAGQSNLSLWDAYNGNFLGRIETDKIVDIGGIPQNDEKNMRIDTTKGIDMEPRTGRINRNKLKGSDYDLHKSDLENGNHNKVKVRVAMGKMKRMIEKGGKNVKKQFLKAGNNPGHISNMTIEKIPSKFGPIKDLAAVPDLSVWVGYKHGILERYSNNGRFTYRSQVGVGLNCLCTVGDRVWVGLRDGSICVIGTDAKEITRWNAHDSAVLHMAVVGPLVYSLAADGSIKGWSGSIPNPALDTKSWQKFNNYLRDVMKQNKIKILCGTWNVNEARPTQESLRRWLGEDHKIKQTDIVVVGLQEVEMGTGSVAMTMAYDRFSKSNLEKGNSNAQWWAGEIQKAISPEDGEEDNNPWKRVCLRQMSGILIYVFVRQSLKQFIGNIASAHVGCGVMGRGGNKGAVAITFTLHRRRLVALSSHFAAHQEAVAKRNGNYVTIQKELSFIKEKSAMSPTVTTQQISNRNFQGTINLAQKSLSPSAMVRTDTGKSMELEEEEIVQYHRRQGIQSADLVVWVGDFNYRVERPYYEALNKIKAGKWVDLLEYDQCRKQMRQGNVFKGMREGKIRFQPTYKFNKGDESLFAYDNSEKMRVPSYTDRIFFRGSKHFETIESDEDKNDETSSTASSHSNSGLLIDLEERPNFLSHTISVDHPRRKEPDEVSVECESYDACMDITDSDHKPIWSLLNVDFPHFIQDRKRSLCFKILKQVLETEVPQLNVHISTKFIEFTGDCGKEVEVNNASNCKVQITVISDQTFYRYMPQWLEATPRQLVLTPNGRSNIHVYANESGLKNLSSNSGLVRVNAGLILRVEAILFGWKYIFKDFKVGVMLRPTGKGNSTLD